MKAISIIFIMLYIAGLAFERGQVGATFWATILGFAAMLAVFHIINLRLLWPAAFGAFSYAAIVVKMLMKEGAASVQTMHLFALVAAAAYCLALAITSKKKPEEA